MTVREVVWAKEQEVGRLMQELDAAVDQMAAQEEETLCTNQQL